MSMLEREEYIEQAFFFRILRERMEMNMPMQDLLSAAREEVLATTNLPKAIDYMLSELLHEGIFSTAMAKLSHYFTAFQTFIVAEAEDDKGRFDFRVGLEILQREAEYLAAEPLKTGLFIYQFETLCRNRLSYDTGLAAIGTHPMYGPDWQEWVNTVRRQIGIIEFSDLLYVRSEHYIQQQERLGAELPADHPPVLFGPKEGRIALANRQKDPLLLLSALHRQLGYPAVPRQKPIDDTLDLVPQLSRRIERLEQRLKLIEDEQKGGIDLTQFYEGQ
jgi:hypothetical protein